MAAQNSYSTATPADDDYVTGVDVSDTTQNAAGSTKSFLMSALATYVGNVMRALANVWTAKQTISVDVTSASGGDGMIVDVTADLASGSGAVQVNGMTFSVAQAQPTVTAQVLQSVNGFVSTAHVAGTVTRMQAINLVASADAGTTTLIEGGYIETDVNGTAAEANGLHIANYINGVATINRGLYIEDVSGGGTNYAIYTNAGAVRFGGALTLGTDLAVTEGGTGASTQAGAQANLDVPSNADAIAYAMIFG